MITINLSEKDAALLKSIIMKPMYSTLSFEQMRVVKEVGAQINNQQFDVSDFENSRQYESLSVNSAYLHNWDKATKNWRFDKEFNK
ncbi:hypothetical protein MM01_00005 [Escherichia phage vB_EcoS_MM01]|uniref:Uncharacterized protein n=1 Tax=Escherichia phage vB_EcoS_MM01 TaxID=2508188 RepID=A0A482N2V6_9CAUD|nr:hypothetical protein MM01_00005 [Escherichia phage vB_EcoS_MM01]